MYVNLYHMYVELSQNKIITIPTIIFSLIRQIHNFFLIKLLHFNKKELQNLSEIT